MLVSTIGEIGQPFDHAFAWLLAAFFALIPNYAIAIALLTLSVMIVVFPITLRGTRGMIEMQLLAPEVRKLRAKFKAHPGMTVAERHEQRQRQQEELMVLYQENNVSPAGGCVPMFLQFPIFIVLYATIRGLVHQGLVNGALRSEPLYISHGSKIFFAIRHAHGQLVSVGLNLADSVRTASLSWNSRVPFIAIVLVAIALQYIQMRQMSGRNPAVGAGNPQVQQMQRIFPLFLALIYISIPAGVNVYFVVSGLFRIAQQELMYRRDPHIQASLGKLREQTGPT